MDISELKQFNLPTKILDVCQDAPSVVLANTLEELIEMACPQDQMAENGLFEVAYDVPDKGRVVEATCMSSTKRYFGKLSRIIYA